MSMPMAMAMTIVDAMATSQSAADVVFAAVFESNHRAATFDTINWHVPTYTGKSTNNGPSATSNDIDEAASGAYHCPA
jgi:hypothetical protein